MRTPLLAILFALSVNAFAYNEPLREDCELTGDISLTEDTTFLCTHDLRIHDGTKINANGYPLQIITAGNLLLGKKPATITSGSEVYIYATTAIGRIEIQASDEVELEYTSTYNYDHNIEVSSGGRVKVSLNGYPYSTQAPGYKLTNAKRILQ